MRKLLACTAVVLGMVGIMGGGTAFAVDGPSGVRPDLETQFVSKLNDLRAQHGVGQLAVHGQLVSKARGWANTMADAGKIWHSNLPDGITVNWAKLGENVGTGGSVQALHDAFVNSPHHYENMVDPDFQYVGIGVVVDANGTIWVAVEFMDLQAAPPTTAPPTTAPPTTAPPTTAPPTTAPPTTAPPTTAPERTVADAGTTPKSETPRAAPEERAAHVDAVLGELRALDSDSGHPTSSDSGLGGLTLAGVASFLLGRGH